MDARSSPCLAEALGLPQAGYVGSVPLTPFNEGTFRPGPETVAGRAGSNGAVMPTVST